MPPTDRGSADGGAGPLPAEPGSGGGGVEDAELAALRASVRAFCDAHVRPTGARIGRLLTGENAF